MQKLKSPSDITDHYVFILTMLLTIYYSSCQTYMSEWIWNTTLFTYWHNNPHKKTLNFLEQSQLSLDLDDPLKLNCIVLPSVSFPTLRWQNFEITIRKNNIRNELHRILLANSIHDLYLYFNIFFLHLNALWKDFLSNLLSSRKRDCTYLTVENGPIAWG